MAGDSGYTTLTHYIDVEVFLNWIQGDIKNLIRTYGHNTCGLKHKEVCDEIRRIITTKKTLILGLMDSHGKQKFNSEWEKQKRGFVNKLYQEEGFINMCFPKTYKNDPSLNQLLSNHIDFCKKKDVWRADIEKNYEYNECVNYNSWINTERKSFTVEYLKNVNKFKVQNVNKYFSVKEHPEGHNPVDTYLNSKLDCDIYNPNSKKYQQKPVAIASPGSPHLSTSPDVGQEFQGKGEKSMPDRVGDIQKNKPDVHILHKTEASSSDSQTNPLTNKKVDGTPNGQNADSKAKGTDLPSKDQGATGQPTEATDTQAQSPEPTISISPKDSPIAKVPDTTPSVTIGQSTVSDSTPRTTSATTSTTHTIENVRSSLTPNLSIDQSQPQLPPVDPGTSNNSKKPTPDQAIKSPALDPPPTTALDPGLASAPEAASNSSVSRTSSTIGSPTTDSIAGSPPAQDPLLITVLPQSTTTTSIVTTSINTQTTTAESGPSTTTVSAIATQPIPSIPGNAGTIEENQKVKAPLKTRSNPQDSISVFPKKQHDSTVPSIGTQSPDQSANLNINLSTGQTLGTSPGPLRPLPDSPADPPPGLSSPIPAVRSPEGSPDVSSPVRVVNKPGKHLNYNLFIQSHL
ncbi:hypothetical protein POVWA2_065000 [Plasmodium ovale wallikeri]|uniref:STP1 protein n=1 Tax=Plasmodium ovale wallikeri TaxID=864142 RepID=A0A1A9ABY7_PLAOA|nr:hypothetical protein POVWA2_065000 [Plasmodium ovale wallikeri]